MINLTDINNLGSLSSYSYAQQNLGEKILNTLGAATVDVGTTIWNSLIPEATGLEVETRQVLSSLSLGGAVAAYDENRDVVDALSFVGGMFIPGAGALKLSHGIRAGLKGTSFLSPTRAADDLVRVEKLLANSAKNSAEYRKVSRDIILRGQANNLMDVAAVEVAMMGTFNAHPYMEDYMKDPISNFALSMAIGGGIGSGLAALASRRALRSVEAPLLEAATKDIMNAGKLTDLVYSDTSTAMVSLKRAASNIASFAENEAKNKLTRDMAREYATQMSVRISDLAKKGMSDEILAAPVEARTAIADLLADTRFMGSDRLSFYKPQALGAFTPKTGIQQSDTPLFQRILKKPNKQGATEVHIPTSYFSPELNAFVGSSKQANLLTTAADVVGPNSLKADLSGRFTITAFRKKVTDFNVRAAAERTGDVELEYLKGLSYYNTRSAKQLAKADIALNDFPAINGYLAAHGSKYQAALETFRTATDPKVRAAAGEALSDLSNAKVRIYDTRGKATELDVQQLSLESVKMKAASIQEAVKGGMPIEVAAIKYNTTRQMAELAVNNPESWAGLALDKGLDAATKLFNRWNSVDSIEEATKLTRRMLAVSSVKSQHLGMTGEYLRQQRDAIKQLTQLDREAKLALDAGDTLGNQRILAKVSALDEMVAEIHNNWIRLSVDSSRSTLAQRMYSEVIDADDIKLLKESLASFNNARGGNPLFQSADAVTSEMGWAGKVATQIGDKRSHIANEVVKANLDPIATKFRQLNADDVARAEFAMLDNARMSNKGYIFYDAKSRRLMTGVLDEETGAVKEAVSISRPVKSEVVHSLMGDIKQAADEAFETQKVINRLEGRRPPSNRGLWMPYTDLTNKEIAYVVNLETRGKKLLVADNKEELELIKNAYKLNQHERILTRAEVGADRRILLEDDLDVITKADVGQQATGIGMGVADISPQRLTDIVAGYRNRYQSQASSLIELANYDTLQKLRYASEINSGRMSATPKTGYKKVYDNLTTKDTAADMIDIITGHNPAYRNELMKGVNQVTDTVMQYGIETVQKLWQLARPNAVAKMDYEQFAKAREAAGVANPFAVFEESHRAAIYQRAKDAGYKADPGRVVRIANEMATVLALKFGELAQPLVNIVSAPIMTISTISRTFKELKSVGDAMNSSVLSIMFNGVRRMNSSLPDNTRIMEMARKEGLLDSIISETDAAMKLSTFAKGPLATVENVLDSTFVKVMSTPSVASDAILRKAIVGIGIETAKRTYGNTLSDKQMMIFIRDFMKQSLGNYAAAQRPVMFQGTFGAAMGLFQTYMLTYAQNMYRHLEVGDKAGLGKMMLAQGGIFGAGSLPGFNPISQMIGANFSDENYDLKTGLYRAVPDEVASVILYGLPSHLGPALHTRGDVSPRVPTGFSTMVAPNMIGQFAAGMLEMAKAATSLDGNTGRAMLEALSTQSASRPLARWSELLTGTSVTGQGRQVAGPEEVWHWQGVLARAFATRTLRETKVREAIHLNSYYGSIDRENRQAVLETMRERIRSGTLTDSAMDDIAYEYLRTGSPQGLRQAMNQAFMETDNQKLIDLHQTFQNSPLMMLVDDLD